MNVSLLRLVGLVALLTGTCDSANAAGSDGGLILPTSNAPANPSAAITSALEVPERLAPLTGSEPRYLAFQVFQGGPDPAIPFDYAMVYTPKARIAAVVRDIVSTIGVTGGPRAKLAFIVGPISFDHSDAEVRQIIDDGFSIARTENIAVGFHIDDSMFWSKRTDLIGDPANVEWTDFAGTPSTGLLLDWAHPPAKMCFNAPRIQAEVTRRARDVIGAEIASQVAVLATEGKADLFAGVIAGWETHMGHDVVTRDRVGFHALSNRGFGPSRPPANVSDEIASIVAEFIALWTHGLANAGVDPTRIYTHVAFLTRAQFATLGAPPGVTYEMLVDAAPSSQRPAVAFAPRSRPGFSTYPVSGRFEQIGEELLLRGLPGWASSEGVNLIPPGPFGNSNMSMETYLARHYNHGATLVTLFAWGIGGPTVMDTDPFRLATQGPDALATYRAFLTQRTDEPGFAEFPLPLPNPAFANCPAGFFVAAVDDGPDAGLSPGIFGLSLLLNPPGSQQLEGGLNFGGSLDGSQAAFAGFNTQNPANQQQRLELRVTGNASSSQSSPLQARISVFRQPSADVRDLLFETSATLTLAQPFAHALTVEPGFHVVTVIPEGSASSPGGAADGQVYVELTSRYLDRPGGGFSAGVVVGGYHAAPPFGDTSGFAAFCLSSAQSATAQVLSAPSYGATGARDLRLRLFDHLRREVLSIP